VDKSHSRIPLCAYAVQCAPRIHRLIHNQRFHNKFTDLNFSQCCDVRID
ncbi:unnamed protein product, partial [Callosobruchus maculatus]